MEIATDRTDTTGPVTQGVFVAPGADRLGERHFVGTGVMSFKVLTEDSKGTLAAFEQVNHAKGGPARHLHHQQDEWFYVVEGQYLLEVGGEQFLLEPGGSAFGPRGVPHAWAFVGGDTGRIVFVFTPAGRIEAFLREVSRTGAMAPQDPAFWTPYDLKLVGPPLDVRVGAGASDLAPEAAIGGAPVTAETSMEVSRFDSAYASTPPWDVPCPQPAFVSLADEGWITGKTLDIGCGTGENALFLAQRGLEVLGVDASGRAIKKARVKADQRALTARFLVADALDLAALGESFDTVIDSGLLHSFSDEDRLRLISEIHTVLRPGGRYLLLCFSEHATLPGPRRLTQDDIRASFGEGWIMESIVPSRFELIGSELGAPRDTLSEQSAGLAWLARIRRT